VQPATGGRFALVMPVVSTEAMGLFLDGVSHQLAADKHAVMVAGWHGAIRLRVPDNITLVPLPSYSPELNPVERLWLYLRERHLSHRLLDDYDAIVDACCVAWNKLTPERIVSLCNYPYLKQVNL
jgi:transposase